MSTVIVNEENGRQSPVSAPDFALVEDIARHMKECRGIPNVAAALENEDEGYEWDDAQRISRINETLERVNRLKSALTFIQESASSAHALARRNAAYIPNQHGIGKLPDEMLSRILGGFVESYVGWKHDAKGLIIAASVCMRFRIIVLSMSQYWSRISSHMHPDLVDMHLVHSRRHPLELRDYWDGSEGDTRGHMSFQDKISSHMHRWDSLSIEYSICPESAIRALTKKLKGLSLPNLRTLKMAFPTSRSLEREEEEERIDDDEFHVYQSWIAPSLRELTVENTIPRVTGSPQFQLTSCVIVNPFFTWCKPFDALDKLMSFLDTQPTLEVFHLNTVSFPRNTNFPVSKRVHLPVLDMMILEVSYAVWSAHDPHEELRDKTNLFAPKIINHLVTPLLDFLCAEFILTPDVAHTFQFNDMFPDFNAYTHLEKLRLEISQTRNFHLQMSPFLTIFTRMPNLKHLSLRIDESEVSGTVPSSRTGIVSRPPPLRTLHLEECQHLNEDSLCAVIEFLSWGKTWSEFEELKVTNCPKLKNCAEALSKWIDPGKVKVERDETEIDEDEGEGEENEPEVDEQ